MHQKQFSKKEKKKKQCIKSPRPLFIIPQFVFSCLDCRELLDRQYIVHARHVYGEVNECAKFLARIDRNQNMAPSIT